MKSRNYWLGNIIPFTTMFVIACIILWIGRENYKEAIKLLTPIGMIVLFTCGIATGDFHIIPNTIIGAAIPTCICTISVIVQLKLWIIIALLTIAVLLMIKILMHYWKKAKNASEDYELMEEQELK